MGAGNSSPTESSGQPTASARLSTTGYFWGLFSLGMVVAAIGPSLPQLAASTGASLGAAGILFSAYRGGYMVGTLVGGSALDRFRGNLLVSLAILVMAVVLAIVVLLPTLLALVIAFAAIGVAAGFVEVGGNTMLVWIYRERVGPWMNGLHFALGLGAMLSPFLIGQSLRITGRLLPAFLIAAPLMIPGAVALIAARSPVAPARKESDGHARDIPMVLLVALLLLFYMGAEASFGGWIYAWSITVHGVTAARAATLTSLFWATLTAGRLLSIPLASRLPPRKILAGTTIGVTLSLALIASPAGLAAKAVVWIATAGAGLSMAAILPTTISFAGRHMRVTGSTSRWFFVSAGAGGMVIPWVMGQLMDGIGPKTVMPAILGVVILMGAALVLLLARIRGR